MIPAPAEPRLGALHPANPVPPPVRADAGFYETNRAVDEYLLFHYGEDELVMPWPEGPHGALQFPERCVTDCLAPSHAATPPHGRALDLGCAVGRASFELARFHLEVVGIDASSRFIAAAQQLQTVGELAYRVVREGSSTLSALARVPAHLPRERVRFETGDALALRADLGAFDVVLAANLLDRVPRPRAFLATLPGLVRPGGTLVLTSPYTWLEEYTPRDEWLGREDCATSAALAELLPDFRLIRRLDLPFVIREHARKFQWSVAEATVWKR